MGKYDVVMTTYATIASDVTKRVSSLQQIMWFRVVLDEGMTSVFWNLVCSHTEIRVPQPIQCVTNPHNNFERPTRFMLNAAGV